LAVFSSQWAIKLAVGGLQFAQYIR